MMFQLKLVTASNENEAVCMVTHGEEVIYKASSKYMLKMRSKCHHSVINPPKI